MSYNTDIQSKNARIQALIDKANTLPEAGGVELPELTNPGTADDLLAGKELIDGEGTKVTGTFTIDSELTTQNDLIAQIQSAVDELPEVGGGEEPKMISITIDSVSLAPLYYYNSSYELMQATPGSTVDALNGIILYAGGYTLSGSSTTEFSYSSSHGIQSIKFYSNGSIATVIAGSGGSDD